MFDQFVQLEEEHLVFLAVITGITTVAITILSAIVAVQARKLRERQLELGFRDDLLRRGYGVDEIVRVVTSARPTRTQSLMTLGDWAILKLTNCAHMLADGVPRLLRPCGRLLKTAWYEGSTCCRALWHQSYIWGHHAWKHGSRFCRRIWRQTRPTLRQTMTSLSQCAHWLADQTDRLVRRLATHQS